jgi:hypothetical protein
MSDGCQCAVFCPCEFDSKPTFGHCDDAAILHIKKGHYGKVSLDGQRIAVVSKSPEGERLVDTVGNLVFARLYVTDIASEEQAQALAAIARRMMGTFIGGAERLSADERVERVPMLVVIEPHHHKVTIPNVLDLEIEAINGGDGKTPIMIKNHPYTALGFGDVEIAHNKKYTYKMGSTDWNYAGRSASIRTFHLKGDI